VPSGIICCVKEETAKVFLAVTFLYLALLDIIWIAHDTRPPFWDMAGHANGALYVYDAFSSLGLLALAAIPAQHLTGYYPPLTHSLIAASWAVFGKTVHVAELTNLVAVAVLMLATYGIGRTLMEPFTAATAAMLVSFYPLMLWLSREIMIDYWLTAIVALAILVLLKTEHFENTRWAAAFGVVAGLGMLTKWTFPFFVILPAAWFPRKNWKNAGLALGIAIIIAAYWYLPSIMALREFLRLNTAGAVFEGDPERFSTAAFVFYVRALEGYQLFFPLFVAFVAGMILLVKRFDQRWAPIPLWLTGGWLGLLLFQNKDPRYSAPLLPAVALVSAIVFERRRYLTIGLFLFLAFQHYLVSFGIPALPESIVLMKGAEGQLSYHWNLYTQSYFGLWGAPAREDWKIDRVLGEVIRSHSNSPVRLGLVPDIPRFDSQAFLFYINLSKLPVHLQRVGVFDESLILGNDYLLVSEQEKEHAASFAPDARVNMYITTHPERFRIADWLPLPNGDVIRLYKVL